MLLSIAQRQSIPELEQADQVEDWLSRLHAPMGLELGGDTPAEIALATIAEIQQTLHRASGRPLRELRRGLHQVASSASR
jgi:xanthine/CO dehydrogenase XdhC/CoxF family maturation factor